MTQPTVYYEFATGTFDKPVTPWQDTQRMPLSPSLPVLWRRSRKEGDDYWSAPAKIGFFDQDAVPPTAASRVKDRLAGMVERGETTWEEIEAEVKQAVAESQATG